MSKLTVALFSAGIVATAMILISDMPCADNLEDKVHQAKQALKEQL